MAAPHGPDHRRSRSHPDRRDHPAAAARSPQGGAEAHRDRRPVRHPRRRRQRLSAVPARRLGPGAPPAGHGGLQGRHAGAVGLPADLLYAQPPALAAAFARIQNEQLAKLVKAQPDRFLAIATLPMQAPQLAADELGTRCASSASPARRSARTSPARTSTIPSSSRSGRRPPSSAPSSWFIPSTSRAWTGCRPTTSTI